jgi:hypothetical protein
MPLKLHILSDLHLLHCRMDPAEVLGDVLVLAGDIGDGGCLRAIPFAKNYRKAGKPVIYVPGNHEYYGKSMAAELRRLDREVRKAGIIFLYNRVRTLQGVRFIGTTLWTDFALDNRPEYSMNVGAACLGDFNCIFHNKKLLRPIRTVGLHQRALRFLERAFAQTFSGPTVVVSHHAPHPSSVHAKYIHSALNPCFASNLEPQLLRWRPALWVHGHMHDNFDYRIGDTRVVVNPRGYVRELNLSDGSHYREVENRAFDPDLVLEV